MCPIHVEHELAALETKVIPPGMSPLPAGVKLTHKVRKPKKPTILDAALRRGFANNGVIEIENETSEDEAFYEREQLGVVYRLPERGIKLDFIDRVKRCVYLESNLTNRTDIQTDLGLKINPSYNNRPILYLLAQSSRSSVLSHRLKLKRKIFRSARLPSVKLR